MLLEPVQHIGFLLLAPAGAGVDLLGSGDGDLHPGIDLSLLGGRGLALDIGDNNGGDDGRQQCKDGLNNHGDVKHSVILLE